MPQGMMYKANLVATAITASTTDIWEYTAPADSCAIVHFCNVSQATDYGDAQAEGLGIKIVKGNTSSGTGGNTVTMTKGQTGFAAAGGVFESFNTSAANGGTEVIEHEEAFNVQIGFNYRPTPEERIVLSPSERVACRLTGNPADSITLRGTVIIEELGG